MTNPSPSPAGSHKRYFFEKFGITERLLERCLGEALAAGGDYADLYFESVTATSLGVDEQIVKSASWSPCGYSTKRDCQSPAGSSGPRLAVVTTYRAAYRAARVCSTNARSIGQ